MSYDFKLIGRTVNHFFWTLILQATIFIVLGVLILAYPALLIIMASVFFIIMGISTFMLAGKVRRVWHMLPKMIQ